MANDKEIKIGISSEYDAAGEKQAAEGMEQLKQAAEAVSSAQAQTTPAAPGAAGAAAAEAAEKLEEAAKEAAKRVQELAARGEEAGEKVAKGAKKGAEGLTGERAAALDLQKVSQDLARARQGAGRSAEEEAQYAKALEEQMRLESMARRELAAEVTRLTKERKAAAAAGDAEAYKQLGERIKTARKALADMTQAQRVAKIATVQQAQAGMQFASTLSGLASGLKNGTASVADLANGVMSLGMALKAGLGPIGWAMAAIQGLSTALDWFNLNPVTNYLEKQNKELEALSREVDRAREELEESIKRVARLDELNKKKTLNGIEETLSARLKSQKEVQEAEDREARARAAAAKKEEEEKRAAIRNTENVEKRRVQAEVAAGKLSDKAAARRIKAIEDERAEKLNAVNEDAALRENKEAVMESAQAKRRVNDYRAAMEEVFKPYEEALTVQLPTAEEWEALQLRLNGGIAEAIDFARSTEVEEAARRVKAMLEEAGISVRGGTAGVIEWMEAVRKSAEKQKETLTDLEKQAEAKRETAMLSKQKVESVRKEAENDKELAAADEELRRAKEQQAERQKGYAKLEGESLQKRYNYIQRMLAAVQEGTEEYDRWNAELKKVTNAQVKDNLHKINEKYKVIGDYAERDAKTQAQIYAEDRKNLLAKRNALRAEAAKKNLDPQLQERINKELAETEKSIRGLKTAMARSALEAQGAIQQITAPAIEASKANKAFAGNLKLAQKAYVNAMRGMARAAERGDKKSFSQWAERAARITQQMEAIGGYTGKAAEAYRTAMDVQLQVLNDPDHRSLLDKRKDAIKKDIAETFEGAEATARANKEAEALRKKEQKQKTKEPKEPKKQQKPREEKTPRPRTPAATPAAQDVTDQVAAAQQERAAALAQVQGLLAQYVQGERELLPLMQTLVEVVSGGLEAQAAVNAELKKGMSNIKTQIERIKSKI